MGARIGPAVRERCLDAFAAGEQPSRIAARLNISESSVFRLARLAREDGDERGEIPSREERELMRAEALHDQIVKDYRKGVACAAMADRYDTTEAAVRGVIYRALRHGEDVGLVLGEAAPSAERRAPSAERRAPSAEEGAATIDTQTQDRRSGRARVRRA